ncbi:hypothetical protein [Paenibacillus sp. CF384]|uniref:hypothetical protein n=1 Tax=Paenibacillus sp. CF384 TaxID=1884382 RepID=UPI00089C3F07|nr:hypothetical protein [Paenibacillus sp. CF384]SDW72484.1 hypothetical protein SAMN05518855_1004280 [Paenibacillus sp. CF384]
MPFDELLKELQGQKTVQEDPEHLSFDRLFNDSFMGKYSNWNSFSEFLEKGNFQVETHEDIRNIPDELFDRHVARETQFANWNDMLDKATKEASK